MLCDLLQCESSQPNEETHTVKIMKISLNKALEKALHRTYLDKQTDFSVSLVLLGPFFLFFSVDTYKWDTKSSGILLRIYFILCSSPIQDTKKLYWSFIISQVRNFPLRNFTCILRKTISFKLFLGLIVKLTMHVLIKQGKTLY